MAETLPQEVALIAALPHALARGRTNVIFLSVPVLFITTAVEYRKQMKHKPTHTYIRYKRTRDSYGPDGLGSIPGRGKRFFSSP